MTITLKDRIAAIKATDYPEDWKAKQIAGAKLTYERLAERLPSGSYPSGGGKGYWPQQPVEARYERDRADEAQWKE